MRRRQIYAMASAAAELIAFGESKPQVFASGPVPEPALPDKHACKKCGRIVMHGMYLHAKYCKGK